MNKKSFKFALQPYICGKQVISAPAPIKKKDSEHEHRFSAGDQLLTVNY